MRWLSTFLCIASMFLAGTQSLATDVFVYAETGIIEEENKIRVNIYADISDTVNGGELISAGIKLLYEANLLSPVAVKNEIDWYFGSPTEKIGYHDPDVSKEGEVAILIGKLDQINPNTGVRGHHILLGSVTLEYIGDKPTTDSINITESQPGSFSDFVTTEGHLLDSRVTYSVLDFCDIDTINLKSAISTLQILSGISSVETIRVADGDITGDGVVGIGDAISFLKHAAY